MVVRIVLPDYVAPSTGAVRDHDNGGETLGAAAYFELYRCHNALARRPKRSPVKGFVKSVVDAIRSGRSS